MIEAASFFTAYNEQVSHAEKANSTTEDELSLDFSGFFGEDVHVEEVATEPSCGLVLPEPRQLTLRDMLVQLTGSDANYEVLAKNIFGVCINKDWLDCSFTDVVKYAGYNMCLPVDWWKQYVAPDSIRKLITKQNAKLLESASEYDLTPLLHLPAKEELLDVYLDLMYEDLLDEELVKQVYDTSGSADFRNNYLNQLKMEEDPILQQLAAHADYTLFSDMLVDCLQLYGSAEIAHTLKGYVDCVCLAEVVRYFHAYGKISTVFNDPVAADFIHVYRNLNSETVMEDPLEEAFLHFCKNHNIEVKNYSAAKALSIYEQLLDGQIDVTEATVALALLASGFDIGCVQGNVTNTLVQLCAGHLGAKLGEYQIGPTVLLYEGNGWFLTDIVELAAALTGAIPTPLSLLDYKDAKVSRIAGDKGIVVQLQKAKQIPDACLPAGYKLSCYHWYENNFVTSLFCHFNAKYFPNTAAPLSRSVAIQILDLLDQQTDTKCFTAFLQNTKFVTAFCNTFLETYVQQSNMSSWLIFVINILKKLTKGRIVVNIPTLTGFDVRTATVRVLTKQVTNYTCTSFAENFGFVLNQVAAFTESQIVLRDNEILLTLR